MLKPEYHGRRFSAEINGRSPCIGRISYEAKRYYLCQNVADGLNARDKLGYKYSWYVSIGDEPHMRRGNIRNFKLLDMTKEEIENYKVFKKGDKLTKNGSTLEVIATLEEEVVIVKCSNNVAAVYTHQELYSHNWRLKVTPEQKVVELSVAEVAERLGYSPASLKIVDK